MSKPQVASKASPVLLAITAMMLFSMFFGAGNLIFPPALGAQAGDNFIPAILGFLGTGVVLPVLAIIAIALSGKDVRDMARRAGPLFGIAFPVLAYLSIGAFYALPRTGAVSYSTAIQPVFDTEGMLISGIFNFVFFGIALALSYNPNSIVNNLGKFLTPVLLVLLVLLVALAVFKFDGTPGAANEKWADAPFPTGLVEGYLTMDSIAGLAFGIIVISAFKYKGIAEGKPLVKATIWAGVIAGILLGLIYIGLGYIGQIIPNAAQYSDGASLLADAALQLMGGPGQFIFGLIVLLACLTTAVGLIAATSEFFETILPGIHYKAWAIFFSLMSFAMATLGLDMVLAIAAPVIGFLYPSAITLIFISLLQPIVQRKLYFRWTFLIGVWAAVVWAALMTFNNLGWGSAFIGPLISWSPLHEVEMGWVLPTVIATVIGLLIDVAKPTPGPTSPFDEVQTAQPAEAKA
ncbi:Branched-chain amino acid transport system 2 carrier protein [Corynebacterium occultum]|uniref:Branched-chain amino acid transport system 2 carrier protein n=1 Tax=Corynebacterium occultum TaxID=2675219 RepID=A0A6B8VY31_9CORY|nr:branched-chain amino acid transport system II carrier protein [Corynebacterium occultum]QGU07949.1 Branched-chain amino acid transport system 2 carrier protein [Corynebacterium occultum]